MLRSITEFCPRGTQIKSPGGFSFNSKSVAGVESVGGRNGYIIIHFGNSSTRITFHDNIYDNGPPAIYEIADNIRKATNA